MRRYWFRLMNVVQMVDVWPLAVRRQLLRWGGMRVGAGCVIEAGTQFVNLPITLGAGVYINRGCFLDGRGGLALGRRAHLGPHVRLVTSTHQAGPRECRAGKLTSAPIVVGAGCWIGGGANVIAGVTVGDGTVVASGACVVSDLDADGLYAGVPATRRKSLPT